MLIWSSKVKEDGGADAGLLGGLDLVVFANGDKKESSCERIGEAGADIAGGDALSIRTTKSLVGEPGALRGCGE